MEKEEAKGNSFGGGEEDGQEEKEKVEVEGGGVKDKEGKVQVENSRMLEVWREYYQKLLERGVHVEKGWL